ncbi:Peptide-methionine (S)-S-oxide reductase [Podila humilis]|nr:Peptide-methionine (S)-S-oxide reductase [Podila humilis]
MLTIAIPRHLLGRKAAIRVATVGLFPRSFHRRFVATYNSSTPSPPQRQKAEFPTSTIPATEVATFAAGCFWGVEKAFQRFGTSQGLTFKTRVGYTSSGGNGSDTTSSPPTYKTVCSGKTQYAEALQIVFTPTIKVQYADLVEFFYRMHDPTTLNYQGPDRGPQYRSAIFTHSDAQDRIAKEVTAKIQEIHFKNQKIVTQIVPAGPWYDAEDYHQKYLEKNPRGYECPSHYLRW